MVNYNPKEWFRFIVTFNRADTVRKLLPILIGIGVHSFVVVHALELLELSENLQTTFYLTSSAKAFVKP